MKRLIQLAFLFAPLCYGQQVSLSVSAQQTSEQLSAEAWHWSEAHHALVDHYNRLLDSKSGADRANTLAESKQQVAALDAAWLKEAQAMMTTADGTRVQLLKALPSPQTDDDKAETSTFAKITSIDDLSDRAAYLKSLARRAGASQ